MKGKEGSILPSQHPALYQNSQPPPRVSPNLDADTPQTRFTPSPSRNRLRGASAPRLPKSRCGRRGNSVHPSFSFLPSRHTRRTPSQASLPHKTLLETPGTAHKGEKKSSSPSKKLEGEVLRGERRGFWGGGSGGRLGRERVGRSPACGACVCLAGVKKKERANRDRGASAPRSGERRCGQTPNSVQTQILPQPKLRCLRTAIG